MQKPPKKPIHPLTAKFVSADTEAAFQDFVFLRNIQSNLWGLGLGLFLYIIYVFIEPADSAEPQATQTIRVLVVALSVCLLALFMHRSFRKRHDLITAIVILLMGVGQNLMVWVQPSLENTYYVGLIQGLILFGLLLRVNFVSMVAPVTATFLMFCAVVFSKGDVGVAALQSANILVVSAICLIGVYLIQRYQREDFFKSQTIEIQNEQLKELLEAEKKDNKRKIAALNMLVHFIKTPLHQITGFSDILVDAMRDGPTGETAENARYIKNATANLTKSVNGLLTYHRLDEAESRNEVEEVKIATVIEDLYELMPDGVAIAKGDVCDVSILADPGVLRAALNGIAEHYAEKRNEATHVSLSTDAEGRTPTLVIRDNARVLSAASYEDLVLPLTQITGYLAQAGDELPMALRTVARAVEIMGGDLAHTALPDGNRYILSFPAAKDNAAAA